MTSEAAPAPTQEPLTIVPIRHPGRWVSGVVVLVLVGLLGYRLATLDNIEYHDIGHYLFQRSITEGVVKTLELAVLSQVIGVVLGTVLATMRLSRNPVLSAVSWSYIWFFRGTPLFVQVLFWFNGAIILVGPRTHLSLFGWSLYDGRTSDLLTVFVAATLALALNEAAYMAEIVRAGLLAVDSGQTEAAEALGMTPGLVLRRIVLPQAMRVVIPPTGNEFISMLKNTALVQAVATVELFGRAEAISAPTGEVFELLTMASIWYLFMTSVAYVGQYYLERRFARGSARELPPTPLQRVRRALTRAAA